MIERAHRPPRSRDRGRRRSRLRWPDHSRQKSSVCFSRAERIDVALAVAVRGMPAEREGHRRAAADGELRNGAIVGVLQLDVGVKLERVGAVDGAKSEIGSPHPGDRAPVAEAQHELHAHAHAAALAAHDAENVDMLLVAARAA